LLFPRTLLEDKKFLFPKGRPTGTQTWAECEAFCTRGMLLVLRTFRKKYSDNKHGGPLPINANMLTTVAFLVERRLNSKGFGAPGKSKAAGEEDDSEAPAFEQYFQVRIPLGMTNRNGLIDQPMPADVLVRLPAGLQRNQRGGSRSDRSYRGAADGIQDGKSTRQSKGHIFPRLRSGRTALVRRLISHRIDAKAVPASRLFTGSMRPRLR
jgi:hypothetical protein